jgi:hypothetical protein
VTVTAPTAPYRVTPPPAYNLQTYLGWFTDRVVRTARDPAIQLVLAEFGVRAPAGGFVDSDGRNAHGTLVGANGYGPDGFDADGYNRDGYDADGFNADGFNVAGDSREDAVEDMVEGWSAEKAAAVLRVLADRVA